MVDVVQGQPRISVVTPSRAERCGCGRDPSGWRGPSSIRPSAPWTSETVDETTARLFHPTGASTRCCPGRELCLPFHALLRVLPADKLGLDRQLVSRQPHGGVRRRPVHAFHLEQDLSGPDHRHPLLQASLPLPMRVSAGFLVIGLSGNSRSRREMLSSAFISSEFVRAYLAI